MTFLRIGIKGWFNLFIILGCWCILICSIIYYYNSVCCGLSGLSSGIIEMPSEQLEALLPSINSAVGGTQRSVLSGFLLFAVVTPAMVFFPLSTVISLTIVNGIENFSFDEELIDEEKKLVTDSQPKSTEDSLIGLILFMVTSGLMIFYLGLNLGVNPLDPGSGDFPGDDPLSPIRVVTNRTTRLIVMQAMIKVLKDLGLFEAARVLEAESAAEGIPPIPYSPISIANLPED